MVAISIFIIYDVRFILVSRLMMFSRQIIIIIIITIIIIIIIIIIIMIIFIIFIILIIILINIIIIINIIVRFAEKILLGRRLLAHIFLLIIFFILFYWAYGYNELFATTCLTYLSPLQFIYHFHMNPVDIISISELPTPISSSRPEIAFFINIFNFIYSFEEFFIYLNKIYIYIYIY